MLRLQGFRIQNFKSIVDSKWHDLSADGVTALIGQNEAGKSAVLEALEAFSTGELSHDFLRPDESEPVVCCSFRVDPSLWNRISPDIVPRGMKTAIREDRGRLNIGSRWDAWGNRELFFEQPSVSRLFTTPDSSLSDEVREDFRAQFLDFVMAVAPRAVLFTDFRNLLPSRIWIDDLSDEHTDVEGYAAARNFLTIAGARADELKMLGRTEAQVLQKLERWGEALTADFHDFWSQPVAGHERVVLEMTYSCEQRGGENPGRPYFAFWVKDGRSRLHLKQRSKGLQWFLAFYLQLKADADRGGSDNLTYLIDEPGGSLHDTAQRDVLKIMEQLGVHTPVVYTTHSPSLVDPMRPDRILAVQRADDRETSPTRIINADRFIAASKDTLFPLLAAMGADVRFQNVVKPNSNVLLEESSARFYLRAFARLTGECEDAHFVSASGVNKLVLLANLLNGWGVSFVVLVDDDKQGKGVIAELTRDVCAGDEDLSAQRLMTVSDCAGIEDVFERQEFWELVLGKTDECAITTTNSRYMRGKPKVIPASNFYRAVCDKRITLASLTDETALRVQSLMQNVAAALTAEEARTRNSQSETPHPAA